MLPDKESLPSSKRKNVFFFRLVFRPKTFFSIIFPSVRECVDLFTICNTHQFAILTNTKYTPICNTLEKMKEKNVRKCKKKT